MIACIVFGVTTAYNTI